MLVLVFLVVPAVVTVAGRQAKSLSVEAFAVHFQTFRTFAVASKLFLLLFFPLVHHFFPFSDPLIRRNTIIFLLLNIHVFKVGKDLHVLVAPTIAPLRKGLRTVAVPNSVLHRKTQIVPFFKRFPEALLVHRILVLGLEDPTSASVSGSGRPIRVLQGRTVIFETRREPFVRTRRVKNLPHVKFLMMPVLVLTPPLPVEYLSLIHI